MIAEPKIFLPIPTDSYPAKIRDVEPTKGQYGPQWKWTFELGGVQNVEDELEPDKTLTYYTPNYITAKNKLGKMLQALGLPIDEPIDSNDFVGRSVVLSVTEAVRDDGTIGNNIEAVLPPRKKKSANGAPPAPAQVALAEADDDDDSVPF